jgi:hypothetical protein
MPSSTKIPRKQVDPLNLENKSDEELIQMALEAVKRNGFKENGQPWLPLRKAALNEWVSEMGRRGIPLHASAVAQHASVISSN